jgi:hypothetical protein
MEGHIVSLELTSADDLDREVFHHVLTEIQIPKLGLQFCSERTAGLELTLSSLLGIVAQDIRENAQQIQNTESDDR